MRVVLDTSVIVSGLRSRYGASFRLLRAVRDGLLVPLATPSLFLEYEAVLKRAEHLRAAGLTPAGVDRFLDVLAVAVEPVEIRLSWRPQLTDPNDEMVLEAAVNGRAEALVTHNIRDFRRAAPRFDLRLLTPGEMDEELSG